MAINRRGGLYRGEAGIGEGISSVQAAVSDAEGAATAAALSEAAAAASEAAAALSEAVAAAAAVSAEDWDSLAQEWATNAEDLAVTGYPGEYSALHHSAKASTARVAAEAAQLAAETAETAAELAETNAETAQTAAETARDLAQTYAGDALSYLTSTSDLYDLFDDRFLGSKTTNPTLDNDGDALVEGTLYWNSVANELRAYNGSAWVAAVVPTSLYVAVAGDTMTGVLNLPAGDAAAPSLTFNGDADSGIFSDSANTVRMATSGVTRLTVQDTSLECTVRVRTPDGTAAAPTHTFVNDADTGLFVAGTNSLGITAGGTQRMSVSSTAVTTTVPNYAPAGSAAAPTYTFTGDANTGLFQAGADQIGFSAGGSERFRVTSSGSIQIGITSPPSASVHGVQIGQPGNNLWQSSVSVTSSFAHMIFFNPNGAVGSITTSASGTSYATTSDYRLKTGARPVLNAIDRINAVPVREYKWISDPSGPYSVGFFAHEMQAVLPDSVMGAKDQLDDKGRLYPQMIDYSKAVPLLWAAVQELSAKVAALEARGGPPA